MNKKLFLRSLAALSAILLVLPCLLSMQSPPKETAVMGVVNGEEVYYDEIYFLAANYLPSLEAEYGDDEEAIRTELDLLIRDNITYNYAILQLCENNGLKYSDVSGKIGESIDRIITEDFADDRSIYQEWLKECGMTERYFRYTTGIDLLSELLPQKYIDSGRVPSEEGEIIKLIEKNFVHVKHLVLFNDKGDDPAKNRQKMEEALALLNSGEAGIDALIADGYTEDFSDPDGSGYFIAPGAMIEEYDAAVFDTNFKVGDYTDIITAHGRNNQGEYVECYYIIHRLDLTTDVIDENYITLKNEYINSVINADLQRILEGMEFEVNEKYLELDLLALKEPVKSTNTVLITVVVIVVVAIVAAVVVVIVLKNKHKKKNVSYKKA